MALMIGRNPFTPMTPPTIDSFDYSFKIVLIGESGTGKTSVAQKFINGASAEMDSDATVGVDFLVKTVLIDGKKVKLHIWDTAGQERFHTLTQSYYRNADGVILLYDVTTRMSFLAAYEWMDEIRRYSENGVLLSLVGNKADLVSCREVSLIEAQVLIREMPEVLFVMETSAKENWNIEKVFMRLATELKRRKDGNLHDQIRDDENIVRLGKSPAVPESKCCI